MPRVKRKCMTALKPVYGESGSEGEEEESVPAPKKPLRSKPSESASKSKSPRLQKTKATSFKNLKKTKVHLGIDNEGEEGDLNQFKNEIDLSESGSDSEFEGVPAKITKLEEVSKPLVNRSLEMQVNGAEKIVEKKETEKVEKKRRGSRRRKEVTHNEKEKQKTEGKEEKREEKVEKKSREKDEKKRVETREEKGEKRKVERSRRQRSAKKIEEKTGNRNNKQQSSGVAKQKKLDPDDSDFEEVTQTKKSRKSRRNSKRTEDDMPQLSMEQIAKYENADVKDIKAMLMTFENGLQTNKKEDSVDDWEEVEEGSPKKAESSAAVEITIDGPNLMRKKKKKTEFDMMEWFRLQINRFRRETQMDAHKVHLLCLVAHGRYINNMCSHPPLQALCLSLVPMATASLNIAKWDLKAMNKFMSWFNDVFKLVKEESSANQHITKRKVMRSIQSKKVMSRKEVTMIYVTMVRSLGHEVRIVHSLQPVSFKATDLKPKNGSKKSEDETDVKTEEKKPQIKENKKTDKKQKPVAKNSRQRRSSSKVNYVASDEEVEEDEGKRKKRKKKSVKKEISEDEFVESETEYRSPVTKIATAPVKDSSTSDDLDWWAEVYLLSMKKWICVECVEGRVNHTNDQEKKITSPMAYVVSFDSDFAVKDITKKYAKNWMSYTRKLRTDEEWWKASLLPLRSWKAERESLEDAEIEASFIKQPLPTSISDYKNHPLYALRRHLLKFEALYPDTAVPVGFLKNKEPVYARECVKTLHSRQNWLKDARLVRIKEEPYKIVKARMTPRRAKVYDGKSEPMLEIFGFWQTEEYIPPPAHDGKVPRNEYGNVELFRPSMLPGGTVHLKGMAGLNRIARKLNIDCAAAMTGWSLHGGHNHPLMEGWVVCEEHKDILLAAWDEEQEIIKEKEQEKKEKRSLGNWKRLIQGALVRERLKHRFKHLKEKPKEETPTMKEAESSESAEKVTDTEMSWPRNLQDKNKKAKKSKKHSSVPFPFEVETM